MTHLNEAALEAAKEKVLDGRGERIWLEDVCMQFLKTYLAALPMGDASTRKDEAGALERPTERPSPAQPSSLPTLDMHLKAMHYAVQEAICHYNAFIESNGEIS